MSWTMTQPTFPGLYWFKGSRLAGKYREPQVVLATVVEVARDGERLAVWFHRGPEAVPLSDCDGQWSEPLDVPR